MATLREMANESTVKDCCVACATACEMTGTTGTLFDRPFIGRPVGKLIDGDQLLSLGGKPHVLGVVKIEGKQRMVKWSDREDFEVLRGGMVLCLHRADEPRTASGETVCE